VVCTNAKGLNASANCFSRKAIAHTTTHPQSQNLNWIEVA